MANLFDSAAKKGKATKKAEKTVLAVEGEEFDESLRKVAELRAKMADMEAELKMAEAEVREAGKEEWTGQYKATGKNPGSVILTSDSEASVTFIAMDRYLKIDDERAEYLESTYGPELVERETTYAFNTAILEKYQEVISALIMDCEDIKEADKAKLIVADTKIAVAKGSIDNITKYDDSIVEDLGIVYQLKNPKLG
jgi:hypothetical protein